MMSAESETSEIIRRRLFEWDETVLTQEGRVMLPLRSPFSLQTRRAQRDLKENVWCSYKNILLLGKDNHVRTIDLGLVHPSAAESLTQLILYQLRQTDNPAGSES